jgi:adenylate cyclase
MLAMWNAPTDQADHAILACRAALAMLGDLPGLSEKWRAILGKELALGIGVNTGKALVGNVGSKHRLKYGPFGHTVNLASRVEGATKQLGIPVLITSSTRQLVGDCFATRRLCRVRVVGIDGSIDLYELHSENATPEWLARRDSYETALGLFEKGDWHAACRSVNSLLAEQINAYDIPSLDLIARSVELIKRPPEVFDSVMELRSK